MNIKSLLIAAASTAGILTLSTPASAVIFDWEFTNTNGSFTTTTPANQDIVRGFVEFNDADVASGTASAIDLQITSVTNLPNGSDPFFGDGGIELNTNLALSPSPSQNSFDFNGQGDITSYEFDLRTSDNNFVIEQLILRQSTNVRRIINTDEFSFTNTISSSNSSTLTFQEASASVPFEFSPTLGLFLVGSIFAGRSYIKRRQALSLMENK